MAQIVNYKKEFVERTKQLVENEYESIENKGLEVTFLLNCLLGLIIIVNENNKIKSKINRIKLEKYKDLIPDKIAFINNIKFNENLVDCGNTFHINGHINSKNELIKNKDLNWFIKKLRNCIAHQNIEILNYNTLIYAVKMWNMNYDIKDFEVIFTIYELKAISLQIAEDYLILLE